MHELRHLFILYNREGALIGFQGFPDAMTSKRSYRDVIPQAQVREELVKGTGSQFDPEYARIMICLLDEEYTMRESENRPENHIS